MNRPRLLPTKRGVDRKPYTFKRPPARHRKPELLYLYTEAFERLQSFKLAGAELGVTGRAVQVYLQRAGARLVKKVVFPTDEYVPRQKFTMSPAAAMGLRYLTVK